jgi:outer membrane protein OmpA-like peptidoglycan-associated protein
VTAPTAGSTANRGSDLVIGWDAADPEVDPLTTDLLISGDDGHTWEPLAVGVSSPATVTVPADLDGDRVRVRVVVSDGVQMATADSEAFTVGGAHYEIRDRVAFARPVTLDYERSYSRLFTMDPNGSDEVEVGVPRSKSWDTMQVDNGEGGTATIGYRCPNLQKDGSCPVVSFYPAWSPDGSRIYFTSDLVDKQFGGAAIPGTTDYVSFHLWSANPDGTDLKRITDPVTSKDVPYRSSNWCVDVGRDRLVWVGAGSSGLRDAIWSSALDGTDQKMIREDVSGLDRVSDETLWPAFLGSGWNPDANYLMVPIDMPSALWEDGLTDSKCPRISPDGRTVAFVSHTVQADGVNDTHAVVLMDIDGANARIVTDYNEHFTSADWVDDDTLLLTKQISGSSLMQHTYEAITLDKATLERQRLAAWPITQGPQSLRTGMGPTLYGATTTRDSGGGVTDMDLGLISEAGVITSVPKAGRDSMFDATRSLTAIGPDVPLVTAPVPMPPKADAGGPYWTSVRTPITLSASGSVLAGDPAATVAWDLDGDGAFDDAEGRSPEVSPADDGTFQVKVRVTPSAGAAVTSESTELVVAPAPVPQFDVDPAAAGSPTPLTGPNPLQVTVAAGEPTEITLDPDGGTGPFVVTALDPAELDAASGDGPSSGPGLASTGTAGSVWITADPDFRGTTRFTYARGDDLTRTATVEVTVTGNAAPVAGDDAVTADAGELVEFPPSQFLANDHDPQGGAPASAPQAAQLDAPAGLRIVSVYGMTGSGQAWLTRDADSVVVVPGAPGTATFTYVVADSAGATDSATVTVSVRGAGSPPPGEPGTTPPSQVPPGSTPPSQVPPGTTPPSQVPPATTRPAAPVATSGSLSERTYFKYASTKLTRAEKRKLRELIAQVPAGATVSTRAVGVVRTRHATKTDRRRALARARVVRDYLVTHGLRGAVVASNTARTSSRKAVARRVNVIVTYTTRP